MRKLSQAINIAAEEIDFSLLKKLADCDAQDTDDSFLNEERKDQLGAFEALKHHEGTKNPRQLTAYKMMREKLCKEQTMENIMHFMHNNGPEVVTFLAYHMNEIFLCFLKEARIKDE